MFVGTTDIRAHDSVVPDPNPTLVAAQKLEPSLANYRMPPRDTPAIVQSFRYQTGRIQNVEPDVEHIVRTALEVNAEYPRADIQGFGKDGVPNWAEVSRVAHMRLHQHTKFTSTPGVPLNRLAQTNAKLLAKHSFDVLTAVLTRAKALMEWDPVELQKLTPVQLVKLGLVDPIKVFVKNEPHDYETKIKTGRVRLISSVSIIDSHVERMYSTDQNDVEKAVWLSCPTSIGIGFTDQMNRALFSVLDSKGPRAESDISGWDFSVQDWELVTDSLRRVQSARVPVDSPLARLIINRHWCLANSVFAMPDGSLLAQSVPGSMKSGSYNTAQSNSWIRVWLARNVGSKWAKAAGDDCVEQRNPHAAKGYQAYGRIVKFYKECPSDSFEFCSRIYYADRTRPIGAVKGLLRLLSNRTHSDALMTEFRREYREAIEVDWCVAVALLAGWGQQKDSVICADETPDDSAS